MGVRELTAAPQSKTDTNGMVSLQFPYFVNPEINAIRKCGKLGFVGVEVQKKREKLSISGIEVSSLRVRKREKKRQNEQKTERKE